MDATVECRVESEFKHWPGMIECLRHVATDDDLDIASPGSH